MSEEERPYTTREIDAMFSRIKESQSEQFKDIKESLDRIEAQTTRTNGRVNKHDSWISIMKGSVAVILALVIPLTVYAFNLATKCADGSCQVTTTINK